LVIGIVTWLFDVFVFREGPDAVLLPGSLVKVDFPSNFHQYQKAMYMQAQKKPSIYFAFSS